MLLEAQRKLQSSSQQDTQTPRSTASIAVGTGETGRAGQVPGLGRGGCTSSRRLSAHYVLGTLLLSGASLFWGQPDQPVPHEEVQASPPPSSSASHSSSSSRDLSIIKPVGEAEDAGVPGQVAPCSPSR